MWFTRTYNLLNKCFSALKLHWKNIDITLKFVLYNLERIYYSSTTSNFILKQRLKKKLKKNNNKKEIRNV